MAFCEENADDELGEDTFASAGAKPMDASDVGITYRTYARGEPNIRWLILNGFQTARRNVRRQEIGPGRSQAIKILTPRTVAFSYLLIYRSICALFDPLLDGTSIARTEASMDPLTSAAAAGLQSRMDSLDMLANNLSNTSTSGFKADREFYSTYIAPELAGQSNTVGASPVVQKPWTDFSQGTLQNTGNATDLGLSGSGFFSVNGPNGPLYTRNGNFHISSQGTLVSSEGYSVRMSDGSALQTDPNFPIKVQSDGQILQNGNVIGQLELTEFKDPTQLTKSAAAYFSSPGTQAGATPAANTQVNQGELETSNAQPAESAARMVSLLRNFEMLQKAVKIGNDMNTQAIEQVAKVSS